MPKEAIRSKAPFHEKGRLELPAGTKPLRINFRYAFILTLVHLLALLALVPAYFSWLGVGCFIVGYFLFGMFGITIGYHRLLTHRSFRCSKWLEYTLAMLGVCCLQESPVRWVAIHRMHHRHSDQRLDPHSPLPHALWGYAGWLFVINKDHWEFENYTRYARDLMRQPFYATLEKHLLTFVIYVVHALLFFALGWSVGWYTHATISEATTLGISVLVWGVFLRTVVFMHVTWSVNAVTHLSGYQNYETGDNSRNNWLIGILALGEGWHNNHHAYQRAAAHGHRWWEFDLSYRAICFLERLGLASHVVRPNLKREAP